LHLLEGLLGPHNRILLERSQQKHTLCGRTDMAFPESLKATLRARAKFRCCLCEALGVELHHIVPQAEGGTDEEENAAPLCPSCHETYGANPVKRKLIREARDHWYKLVASREAIFPSVSHVLAKLDNTATS